MKCSGLPSWDKWEGYELYGNGNGITENGAT